MANVLYVCVSGDPGLMTYAFNASNGALRWQRETGCQIVSIPFQDYALPILANGLLYTGRYALDPADGAIRWQMPIDATVAAVVDRTIYAYSQQTLYALTIGNGMIRWQYQLSAPIAAVPVVAAGRIYAGDINGDSPPAITPSLPDAHALDASSGKVLWSYPSGIVSSISMDQAGRVDLLRRVERSGRTGSDHRNAPLAVSDGSRHYHRPYLRGRHLLFQCGWSLRLERDRRGAALA